MPDYFDKAGRPIPLMKWAELFENREYRLVQQEVLPDGRWVSTVWLGLNHQYGDGPPLIFENYGVRGATRRAPAWSAPASR